MNWEAAAHYTQSLFCLFRIMRLLMTNKSALRVCVSRCAGIQS